MYLQEVEIRNVRGIQKLVWEAPKNKLAGWHVLIGDNGSGKTTFLRSVALALIGRNDAEALRQDWNDWLRRGAEDGEIIISFAVSKDAEKFYLNKKQIIDPNLPIIGLKFSRQNNNSVELSEINNNLNSITSEDNPRPFSSSYGPFRRFSGGSPDYGSIFRSRPSLAAHLSVFGEDVALTEYFKWLQDLQFKKLENRPEGNFLDYVREFVNQEGFLPHQARLENITSDGVEFVDGEGNLLTVDLLSDGYRSILSMTFEIIRQLSSFYGWEFIFDKDQPGKIIPPGIVMIDEVDAHLHPTWQRQIGLWFREHFPNIQFIITTHSPLVCQAAEIGSVWRLPKPGRDEREKRIEGIDLDRLLYGNVLDAYGTEVFGRGITRSEDAKQRLSRLAELNIKELRGGLSKKEREEQIKLRAAMPTSAHITDLMEEETDDTVA